MTNKTGPKPKELKEFIKKGIEVGRGDKKRIVDPVEVQKLAAKLHPKTAEEVLLLPYQFHAMLRILLIKDLVTDTIAAYTDETQKIITEEYIARSIEYYRTDSLFLTLVDAMQIDTILLDNAWVNAETL